MIAGMILAACVCTQPKALKVEVCTAENVSTALTLALKNEPMFLMTPTIANAMRDKREADRRRGGR